MDDVVRPASRSEVDIVARILSESFQDDPVNAWVFPGAEHRRSAHPVFFKAFTEAAFADGEVYLAHDHSAASLWFRSEGGESPEEFLDRFAALDAEDFARLVAVTELLGAHMGPEPHLHWQFCGVVPTSQRHGLGSAIARQHFRRIDAEGIPCAGEASNPDSARLWRRHGFVDAGEPFGLPGGPRFFPIWREPQG
ncbi:GNAT family N-acetyltransferase [Kutzneria sp. 744]|uniref:GNAT family N-acetyltransferase n=1 Tax=Kutzneria sp. (strain 744) TaxID=345341 RepID=UPI0005BE50C1|nr:GNAT family N-acetyltransferase [Kutzneria sp. 744]